MKIVCVNVTTSLYSPYQNQKHMENNSELKDWVKERIFKLRKSINKAVERDSIDHILNAEQQKEVDMLNKILHAL